MRGWVASSGEEDKHPCLHREMNPGLAINKIKQQFYLLFWMTVEAQYFSVKE
jgi:hypothetical protein